MTLPYRALVSGLVLPFVAALAATPAQAQTPSTRNASLATGESVAIEGYFSHYRLDNRGDDRIGMDGIGARLMWSPTDGVESSRAAVGLFAEFAPKQDLGFSVVHTGVQGDLNLVSSPLFGRVEPLASLGAGFMWTHRTNNPAAADEFPLTAKNRVSPALSPAIGARVRVWNQMGMRADIRDIITVRDRTLHNLQYAVGVTLPF